MVRNALLAAAALIGIAIVAAIVFALRRGDGADDANVENRPPESTTVVAGDRAAGGAIEVFFTTPVKSSQRVASGTPGRLDERLTAEIDKAQRTLDVAIYQLSLDNVADALVRAQQRGVRVRLVTDSDSLTSAQVQRVKAAGVPLVEDKRGPIMHHKFVVLDGAAVWTGSWNFTTGGTFRDDNNAMLIRSRELADNFTTEFEKMFVDKKFGPTKRKGIPYPRIEVGGVPIETVFESEEDAPARIIERLKAARQSVVFMSYVFTHDQIGDAVIERARAGVALRGVLETTGSDRPESEYGRLRQAGLITQAAAGAPRPSCGAGPTVVTDASPNLMHHKVIVIDGRTVIFGSFNFTRNAAEDNDENLLIVDDPAIAARYLDEFCRVYNLGAEKARAKP